LRKRKKRRKGKIIQGKEKRRSSKKESKVNGK